MMADCGTVKLMTHWKAPFRARPALQVPTAIKAPPVVQVPSIPVVSSDLLRTIGPQVTPSTESLNSSQQANREFSPIVEQAAMQKDASRPQPVPKAIMTPQPSLLVVSCHYNSKETVPCLWKAHRILKGHCL